MYFFYAVMARILLVIKAYFRDINANTWIQYMENTRKIQQMERVLVLCFVFEKNFPGQMTQANKRSLTGKYNHNVLNYYPNPNSNPNRNPKEP